MSSRSCTIAWLHGRKESLQPRVHGKVMMVMMGRLLVRSEVLSQVPGATQTNTCLDSAPPFAPARSFFMDTEPHERLYLS